MKVLSLDLGFGCIFIPPLWSCPWPLWLRSTALTIVTSGNPDPVLNLCNACAVADYTRTRVVKVWSKQTRRFLLTRGMNSVFACMKYQNNFFLRTNGCLLWTIIEISDTRNMFANCIHTPGDMRSNETQFQQVITINYRQISNECIPNLCAASSFVSLAVELRFGFIYKGKNLTTTASAVHVKCIRVMVNDLCHFKPYSAFFVSARSHFLSAGRHVYLLLTSADHASRVGKRGVVKWRHFDHTIVRSTVNLPNHS